MNSLILDPLPGISGDMFLAAASGLGFKIEKLNKILRGIGYKSKVKVVKEKAGHIQANKLFFSPGKDLPLNLEEIIKIINNIKLDKKTKDIALQIVKNIIQSEKHVHKSYHIHKGDIASLDTLVDALGVALVITELKIKQCFFTNINVPDSDRFKSHFPSLAPATLELLKGFKLRYIDLDKEIITPTGASIIKTLCKKEEKVLQFIPLKISYARGNKNLGRCPNLFRLILCSLEGSNKDEEIYVLETAVDDMSPEVLSYLQEKLFRMKALDVYLQPYYGKKNRVGFSLKVLCEEESLEALIKLIFRETTTNGIRYYKVRRKKLLPKIDFLNTRYGKLKIKVTQYEGDIKVKPEYEECKRIAQKFNIPLHKFLKNLMIQQDSLNI